MAEHAAADVVEHTAADTTEHAAADTTEHAGSAVTEGACSFTAATVVRTIVGSQAIGQVHVGEKVLAYNPKTKKMELEPILHVWVHKDDDLVDLTITHTTTKQGKETTPTSEVIHTNKKHPFLTVEKGFLPVGQIKLGMHVVEADGQLGVISGWKVVPGVKVMYNLEVAQDHTFVVGIGQWVVHNCTQPFDIVPYNTKAPGFEKHHGVLDVWAEHNVPGYDGTKAPTMVLTKGDHAATKPVFRDWLFERTGKRVGGRVDWLTVSSREAFALSDKMFDAAGVPDAARVSYYMSFYQYTLGW